MYVIVFDRTATQWKTEKRGFQFQTRVLIICVHKLYQIVQM